jgi:hypothetical protein
VDPLEAILGGSIKAIPDTIKIRLKKYLTITLKATLLRDEGCLDSYLKLGFMAYSN